ncbi:MAG TPA: hypothetical protein EYH56_01050 [Nanoarchaeota archaeon]|nr:hypothetical protein [Nanoarchaeota archaeon]
MEIEIDKYKFYGLLVAGIIIFLINKKLFISLLLIFTGGFLIFTFGKNVYARDLKVVKFGVSLGILLIVLGIILLIF